MSHRCTDVVTRRPTVNTRITHANMFFLITVCHYLFLHFPLARTLLIISTLHFHLFTELRSVFIFFKWFSSPKIHFVEAFSVIARAIMQNVCSFSAIHLKKIMIIMKNKYKL